MRIIVIGGHGKVARALEPLLVARGHEVHAVIRNPEHAADVTATGAIPVVADLEQLDLDATVELLAGHDALVWSAGAGGGDPARTAAVDRDAAIRTMDASARAGVDRYVMVSYLGAGPDHGVPADHSFHAYAEAKAAADAHLRASDLDWTVVGPGSLTMEPGTGAIELGPHPAASSVPRADVATVIDEVLARPTTIGRTIEFNSGPTPIAAALDTLG
jgi:uncharacterized protein YbjT (DUF2867 family)